MVTGGAIVHAMQISQRHGLIGTVEYRRLIHVIPESRHAHAHETFVLLAPPVACFGTGEIRKYAVARPHWPDEYAAVRILYECVSLHPRVVRRVIVVGIF